MSRMADKYKNRPDTPEFAAMCMAEFAFTYRMGYGRQREGSRVLPLQKEVTCLILYYMLLLIVQLLYVGILMRTQF